MTGMSEEIPSEGIPFVSIPSPLTSLPSVELHLSGGTTIEGTPIAGEGSSSVIRDLKPLEDLNSRMIWPDPVLVSEPLENLHLRMLLQSNTPPHEIELSIYSSVDELGLPIGNVIGQFQCRGLTNASHSGTEVIDCRSAMREAQSKTEILYPRFGISTTDADTLYVAIFLRFLNDKNQGDPDASLVYAAQIARSQ